VPDLPILICSGYADREAAESLVREGAAGFVNKPYHIEKLDQQIKKVIT
jgi:DNA-binding NtrC family response regulator